MKRILKREYTAEFKEQAVAMVNNGRSVPEVAGELGRIGEESFKYRFANHTWSNCAVRVYRRWILYGIDRLMLVARRFIERMPALGAHRPQSAEPTARSAVVLNRECYVVKVRVRRSDKPAIGAT